MGRPARSIVWDSVKFDGSPHRSVDAVDLGSTDRGRWLSIPKGTRVSRPDRGFYDHPCDAVVLVPSEGLWIATWLVDWEPALYVDLARRVSVGSDRVVTMDLDIDVVRRRGGEVEVLDVDEFDLHRRRLGYPAELVSAVHRATESLTDAITRGQPPFCIIPDAPILPRTPSGW